MRKGPTPQNDAGLTERIVKQREDGFHHRGSTRNMPCRFVVNDLQKVDRSVTPWVIVVSSPPLRSSILCPACLPPAAMLVTCAVK